MVQLAMVSALSLASFLLLSASPSHTAADAAQMIDERRAADGSGGPIDALKQQFEEFLTALQVKGESEDIQPHTQEQDHDTAAGKDMDQEESKKAARLTVDKVRKTVSKLKKGRLVKTAKATREQSPYSPEFIAGFDAFVAEVTASIDAFRAALGAEIGDEISVLLVSIEEDLEAIEVLAATGGVDVIDGDLDIDIELRSGRHT
ncbi:unnamed protein product [Vitrella brassicaformis CCMP3155]|uniref:Uncharacterized protein n=1 Tax=Vitrella brassicaformis (strain CCMP3155) TaxID=1169540 RepID=A0A0G4FIN2_VITBC|nr:unnamed protein product [Vitrella brassicaformis CCMP3155]|mmetsp:Transcript_16487/g.39585  ORF Transcript_16487/g.39585 Transcript_16487/m.39585 type:complete len:204 (-) Transcript_16487:3976-4587(-)|eukprot:CEM13151.1 unnamed protein product [Vitrella brassicaformis CCMP3155]